eukprot:gene15102-biopygen14240
MLVGSTRAKAFRGVRWGGLTDKETEDRPGQRHPPEACAAHATPRGRFSQAARPGCHCVPLWWQCSSNTVTPPPTHPHTPPSTGGGANGLARLARHFPGSGSASRPGTIGLGWGSASRAAREFGVQQVRQARVLCPSGPSV